MSLAILAYFFRQGSAANGTAGLARTLMIASLAIYVQLGGLLVKHAAGALAHVAARRANRDLSEVARGGAGLFPLGLRLFASHAHGRHCVNCSFR